MSNTNSIAVLPLVLLTILAGAFLPIQAGVNARLGRELGGPVAAALVSFSVGLLSLIISMLVARLPFAFSAALKGAPWWAWTGGIVGAAFVSIAAAAGPRLGFAMFTALVIAGQLAVSIVLDHFGLLGAARQPVSLGKLAGVALLALGVWLIRRG